MSDSWALLAFGLEHCPTRYWADCSSKWHQQCKKAPAISWIIWQHFCTVGVTRRSIFLLQSMVDTHCGDPLILVYNLSTTITKMPIVERCRTVLKSMHYVLQPLQLFCLLHFNYQPCSAACWLLCAWTVAKTFPAIYLLNNFLTDWEWRRTHADVLGEYGTLLASKFMGSKCSPYFIFSVQCMLLPLQLSTFPEPEG